MEQNIKITNQDGISIKQSLLIFLLTMTYQFLIGFVLAGAGIILSKKYGFSKNTIDAMMVPMGLASSLISYLLVINRYVRKKKYTLALNTEIAPKTYLIIFLIWAGYSLTYGNSLEILVLNASKNSWFLKEANNLVQNPILALIFVCLIAPICEEIIFRGIILGQLCKRYSPIIAVTTSALLFGIFHFNVIQGVNTFLFGLILGMIYIRTQSLVPCIFLHLINNTLVFLLSSTKFNPVQLIIGIIVFVSSLIIFIKNTKATK